MVETKKLSSTDALRWNAAYAMAEQILECDHRFNRSNVELSFY